MTTLEMPPYGSADWAKFDDIHKAGMFQKRPESVFLGYHGRRAVYAQNQGGILTCAAPRTGKFSTQIAYNICGKDAYAHWVVCLDPKGEIAYIAQNQMALGKAAIHWNPSRLHGLPHVNMNPLDHITRGSPTIVSDTKGFYKQWHPLTNAGNSRYFEVSAQSIAEACTVELAEVNGTVDLSQVYRMINLIESDSDEWLEFECDLLNSRHLFVRRNGEELRQHRKKRGKSADSSGGGIAAVIKELYVSFASLDDPLLLKSVSPPFRFSFAQIGDENYPPCNFYMMPPADQIEVWGSVIKGIYHNAFTHKLRRRSAPPMLFLIDECGQLLEAGDFPLVRRLFSIGAGMGMRPWIFLQSLGQLDNLGKSGKAIVMSSATIKCYFAILDYPTAEEVSKSLGKRTIEIADPLQQQNSKLEAKRLVREILQGHTDRARLTELAHHKRAAVHLNKMSGDLMRPEQVMHELADKAIIFAGDTIKPLILDRKHYYNNPKMNGACHPNPEYDPFDPDWVKLAGGTRRVVREPLPQKYAHFPQYEGCEEWSYIKGFKT